MLVSAGEEEVAVVVGYWDGLLCFSFLSFCLPLPFLLLPGEGVPTRTLPFVRGRDIRTNARMGAVKTAAWFRTRVCIPPWDLSSGLVTPLWGWAVRLRRLFIQYHCSALGGSRLTGVLRPWASGRVSRDRGERRTDPVGFRANSYSRRHA